MKKATQVFKTQLLQFAWKMTQIIITFSHAKFAASKPPSNREKAKAPFFPAVIKPMKQKLTENRFVQYFFFVIIVIKIKATARSANEDSEKPFICLNTYSVCVWGCGRGQANKRKPNSDICKSFAVNIFLLYPSINTLAFSFYVISLETTGKDLHTACHQEHNTKNK